MLDSRIDEADLDLFRIDTVASSYNIAVFGDKEACTMTLEVDGVCDVFTIVISGITNLARLIDCQRDDALLDSCTVDAGMRCGIGRAAAEQEHNRCNYRGYQPTERSHLSCPFSREYL